MKNMMEAQSTLQKAMLNVPIQSFVSDLLCHASLHLAADQAEYLGGKATRPSPSFSKGFPTS